jgi:hypothetical protein
MIKFFSQFFCKKFSWKAQKVSSPQIIPLSAGMGNKENNLKKSDYKKVEKWQN